MIIFFSGEGGRFSNPEGVWGASADVMLTYFHSHNKRRPERRFRSLRKIRKKGKGAKSESQP
jgi:hypothetical protein